MCSSCFVSVHFVYLFLLVFNSCMKIKQLGRTGLKVTEICLGTMTFGNQCDEPASFAIMY